MSDTPEEMADSATDRPLVTFALFAYNQEEYIREAVEGAFAQTYEPLEIILSDDCSTDRTFDIMKEMAANYDGPHHVITRRNFQNLGTAMHVQGVADIMTGKLMVVAAGDDISLPHRVCRIVAHWIEKGRCAVMLHSESEEFSGGDLNVFKRRPLRYPDANSIDLEWHLSNHGNPTQAPTAAYSHVLFSDFPPLIGGSVIEDAPLFLRAVLSGVVQSIPEPLVRYRNSPESAGRGFSILDISRWNKTIRSRMISEFNKLQDISCISDLTTENRSHLESRCLWRLNRLCKCVLSEGSYNSIFARTKVFFIMFLC